ncbi:MAG TPA: CBS domain-containing protein [Bacteroidia bacterium]|nr:CBS domain-containing protein [Bacteroidia bacterium]
MKTVKEIMVHEPKHCGKHENLQNVIAEMLKSNIGSLPVVDKEKKVIGIITDRDICGALARTNKHLVELRVHEAMTGHVHTCLVEDSTNTALKIMRTKKVGRLPVVDKKGCLKGILSLNTIIRQLHGSNDGAEAVFAGEENVVNTLHSIAERNNHLSFEHESFEE